MVDFENEITVATPPTEVLKFLILEKRNNVISAIENYTKLTGANANAPTYIIRASLYALFLELQGALYKDLKKETYEDLRNEMESKEYEDLVKAFYIMNEWLYKKRITLVDSRESIDTSRVEKENYKKGL